MMIGRYFLPGLQHLRAYGRAVKDVFDRYPKAASACTGFITFALGDILAQSSQLPSNQKMDQVQSAKVGGLGFVMNGVFLPNWYNFLDRSLGSSMKSKKGVLMKVIADQIVYAPFTIISYFAFFGFIHNKESDGRWESFAYKVKNDLPTTWLADCALWPIANAVNFRFVPLVFRPFFTAFVQLVWQTYLAYVSGRDEEISHHGAKHSHDAIKS